MEWLHHRHLVTEARENIHREIVANQQLLSQDLAHLQADDARMKANIAIIRQLRDNPRAKHDKLSFDLGWSSFAGSAFGTARDTGALAYMPYAELQDLSQLYAQQSYINTLGQTLFTDQNKAPSILASEVRVEDLQLEQLAQLMTRVTDLLAQLQGLEQRLGELQGAYNSCAKLESR